MLSSSIKDWKNLLNSPHMMIPISNFVCSDEFWINDILVLRIRPTVHDIVHDNQTYCTDLLHIFLQD